MRRHTSYRKDFFASCLWTRIVGLLRIERLNLPAEGQHSECPWTRRRGRPREMIIAWGAQALCRGLSGDRRGLDDMVRVRRHRGRNVGCRVDQLRVHDCVMRLPARSDVAAIENRGALIADELRPAASITASRVGVERLVEVATVRAIRKDVSVKVKVVVGCQCLSRRNFLPNVAGGKTFELNSVRISCHSPDWRIEQGGMSASESCRPSTALTCS